MVYSGDEVIGGGVIVREAGGFTKDFFARDGLTRIERVVLYTLHEAQRELGEADLRHPPRRVRHLPRPQEHLQRLPVAPLPPGLVGVSAFGLAGTNAHLVLEEGVAEWRQTEFAVSR